MPGLFLFLGGLDFDGAAAPPPWPSPQGGGDAGGWGGVGGPPAKELDPGFRRDDGRWTSWCFRAVSRHPPPSGEGSRVAVVGRDIGAPVTPSRSPRRGGGGAGGWTGWRPSRNESPKSDHTSLVFLYVDFFFHLPYQFCTKAKPSPEEGDAGLVCCRQSRGQGKKPPRGAPARRRAGGGRGPFGRTTCFICLNWR